MERPKVSICIPCYNNADEVECLLQSIYSQVYTDFEVNISDDSTNDDTEALVHRCYPKVKLPAQTRSRMDIFLTGMPRSKWRRGIISR